MDVRMHRGVFEKNRVRNCFSIRLKGVLLWSLLVNAVRSNVAVLQRRTRCGWSSENKSLNTHLLMTC
jgi:hypothetical protein